MTITKLKNPKADTSGSESVKLSFPQRKPAPKFVIVRTLSLCLFGILLAFICIAYLKPDFSSNILRNLINSNENPQRHKASLINLPGQQFLPTLERPLNVLVMGVDSNGRNTERFAGTRSDTMMLVSIDPTNKKVGVVSIPRDSRVQIARHGADKINSAHAMGGPQLAMETVSQAFGAPIDRYLVIDAQGFKRLLEILGPIDVLVEKKMAYVDHSAKLFVNLEPGLQTLDANQAEQYVRFRHDLRGDIGRIERQQWFARQMVNKLADPQIITKLPDLMKVTSECIVTDLNIDEMVRLFGFACNLDPKQIKMATLPGTPGFINGISYWVLQPNACTIVFDKLINHDLRNQPAHDSAMAYSPMSINETTSSNNSSPWTTIIRYPKGCAEQVNILEAQLKQSGFVVKGKYIADLADCQHEQVLENTTRALSFDLDAERHKLPFLNSWPNVINIDPQAGADLTFVVTPNSQF